MMIDPTQIQLTTEQREQIATVAQTLGQTWEQVLKDALANLGKTNKEDALAIGASIRDLANGETGRSFNDFSADFCDKNDIPR